MKVNFDKINELRINSSKATGTAVIDRFTNLTNLYYCLWSCGLDISPKIVENLTAFGNIFNKCDPILKHCKKLKVLKLSCLSCDFDVLCEVIKNNSNLEIIE